MAGVLVGADGDGRHHGSAQAVAHRVDHRDVQDIAVQCVVEAVSTHVIGGLDDPRDRHCRHHHRQRGEQCALDLRGHTHVLPAPGEEAPVGVGVLGDQSLF
jgi:hypothetical protein